MIKLGSTADTARKAAFRVKIPDIIAVDENASSIRQIMGRTSDSSTVCGWYQQLGIAFAPGQEVWSFVFMQQINEALADRLSFLKLPEGKSKSDGERVQHVIRMRQQHAQAGGAGGGGVVSIPDGHPYWWPSWDTDSLLIAGYQYHWSVNLFIPIIDLYLGV